MSPRRNPNIPVTYSSCTRRRLAYVSEMTLSSAARGEYDNTLLASRFDMADVGRRRSEADARQGNPTANTEKASGRHNSEMASTHSDPVVESNIALRKLSEAFGKHFQGALLFRVRFVLSHVRRRCENCHLFFGTVLLFHYF